MTLQAFHPHQAPPDWVGDIKRKYFLRITDWLDQMWAVTHSPRVFMQEWATGKRETLNPMRFFAVSTAIVFLADRVGRFALHVPDHTMHKGFGWLNSSFGTTVFTLFMAAVMHVFMRGKDRAPLRASIAAVVFSSGTTTMLSILGWTLSAWLRVWLGHVPLWTMNGAQMPYPVLLLSYVGFGWNIATLAGVHRVSWWRPVIALLLFWFTFIMSSGVIAFFLLRYGIWKP